MASPASAAEGNQTAVIDTEHTLATITDPGHYQVEVNLKEMLDGDTVEIFIKKKIRATGTLEGYISKSYDDAQSDNAVTSIPVSSLHEFQVSLLQTAIAGRSFDWEVLKT